MVYLTRVTKDGRLMVPAAVRREMALEPGDSVLWRTEDGRTVLERLPSLAELEGFLPAIDHPSAETDFGEMIRDAQEDLVDQDLRLIGLLPKVDHRTT